jgi:acyl carrier protein
MTVTEQEVFEGLRKIIEEVTGIPASNVRSESSFVDDLDVDSLSMVEIATVAQEEFDVEIPDDQLKNLKTVQDAVRFIQG